MKRRLLPPPRPIAIGRRLFTWGQRTYVMGILNVTPDSFSGDGLAGDSEAAVAQGLRLAAEGADILDVGGESTRPGAAPVPAAEELRRVLPVIERLAQAIDVPISIDTYKAEVARQALAAGASLVNDVWALRADPGMAGVVAAAGVPIILMHNRSHPQWAARTEGSDEHQRGVASGDLMADIGQGLQESVELARRAGIAEEKIIVDPGLGFGKSKEQNLEIMDRLDELQSLGRPILVGPSRKATIGLVLDRPPEQLMEGTAAAVAVCIARGADIVRVHDVQPMVLVARMTDAIVRR
ncbi:MAG: dihydropteroate synthase [Chloroflexi bacterium]|nr:dihydropteroate synthase [Chloroflexota bacterium]